MIQIPHLEQIFFKMQLENHFLFLQNLNSRVGGKNKNINQQAQFYFYSSFGKIRLGGFRNSEKKKMPWMF